MQQETSTKNQKSINQSTYSIYDGLLTKCVNLAAINCNKILTPSQIYLQVDNDSKMNALKYRFALNYLGKKYQKIVVPCTPAYQLAINNNLSQQTNSSYQCFVKVPNTTNKTGIASGKRSAIYMNQHNKLLRFKGCGNQYKGFNQQNNESRGHHFYHTAKRQLYITNYINSVFEKQLGINPPANKPLYAFNYPSQQINNVNLVEDLPQISKYCCVFETQGDRRAGTHLISPLQILFLNLIDHQNGKWKVQFEEKNRIQNNQLVQLVAHFQLFLQPGDKFLQVYDNSAQILNYVKFVHQNLQLIPNYSKTFDEIILKLVPENYRKNITQLLQKLEIKQLPAIVQVILKRIGFQMGQIKRTMCKNEISWGFYLDHGVQWHCNAHLNNFIVSKPETTDKSFSYFMLPLDYDLAYTAKQFICIDLDSECYGKYSEQIFQNYLCGQFSAMEMSLFGLQVMNFKYGIEDFNNSQNKKMGRVAFRDTLVQAFNHGMKDNLQIKKTIQKQWNKHIINIQLLVQICLYLSIDFQT